MLPLRLRSAGLYLSCFLLLLAPCGLCVPAEEPQTQPGPEESSTRSGSEEPQFRVSTGETETKPGLHTFAEIYDIMEKSSLTYELDLGEDLPAQAVESPHTLSPQAVLEEGEGGGYSLSEFMLSKEAKETFEKAEAAFEARDYDLALKLYHKVQEQQPDYWKILTYIGDVYYLKGGYETARSYFVEAIGHNFADYQAHWFLADTEWKLGNREAAVREITTAHLLNVTHPSIKDRLLKYRKEIDRPWKPWEYSPRYSLEKEGNLIKIRAPEEWVGYALVKAVWKYEPGYAESMVGADYGKHVIEDKEEKEAFVAYLNKEKPDEVLSRILDEGYINEFLYYEIVAPRAPIAMALMPREIFYRIVDYIDRYH